MFPDRLEKTKLCAGVVSFPRSSIHPRGENRQPASQIVPAPGGPATGGLLLYTSNQSVSPRSLEEVYCAILDWLMLLTNCYVVCTSKSLWNCYDAQRRSL